MSFWTGSEGQWKQRPWAPGVEDYYKDLLSNDSETFNQMQAPELRRFREQIIPGISEQFAGMGSGGLSSSGFRNAAVGAGTDLSERLGAIRAQLRQQGAQGLQNNQYYEQGQPGFLHHLGGGIGQGLGIAGGMAGGNWLSAGLGALQGIGSLTNQQQQSNYNYGQAPGVMQNQGGGYNPASFLNRGIQ